MSEVSKKLLLSTGTFVVMLAIIEVALRTFTPADLLRLRADNLSHFFESDSLLVFRLVPNTDAMMLTPEFQIPVHINEWGIRESRTADTTFSARRVLFIGDSFTFGLGVEEESTFVRKVELLLTRVTKTEVLCINGGVPGFNSEQQYHWLMRLWSVVRPNAVCWVFFQDDLRFDPRDFWVEESSPTLVDRTKMFLRRHLYLYHFFGTRLTALARKITNRAGIEGLEPVEEVNLVPWNEKIRSQWTNVKGFVARAQELCDRRGASFLLVSLPDLAQVDSARWAKKLTDLGASFTRTNLQASADSLSRFAVRNRIMFLDLRPAIIRSGGERLYYPLDRHLTAQGHSVVARAIAEKLLEIKKELFK